MKKKRITLAACLLVLTLILGACGNQDSNNKGEETSNKKDQPIKFGINNWSENIAVGNMWKILLEKRGYKVKLQKLQKAAVWTATADKEIDISPEVWLPYTDKPYYEKHKEEVSMQDIWYKNTGLGLVVPEYVDIDSIKQLNANKEKFEGNIIGIDPGASLMDLTKKAVKQYGLEYNLQSSSGPSMMAALKKAYDKKEPILVTLWNPHWAFARYDLKYLKDPKGVFGEADNIHYMTRKGFEADYPKVVKWMDKWKMDDASLGSLMATINDVGDPAKGAKQWIEDNQDLVNKWFKDGE